MRARETRCESERWGRGNNEGGSHGDGNVIVPRAGASASHLLHQTLLRHGRATRQLLELLFRVGEFLRVAVALSPQQLRRRLQLVHAFLQGLLAVAGRGVLGLQGRCDLPAGGWVGGRWVS